MVARRDFSEGSKMALRRIDGGRLLLESDAPYFPAAGEELSSPSFIGVTAREVAKIRGGDGGTFCSRRQKMLHSFTGPRRRRGSFYYMYFMYRRRNCETMDMVPPVHISLHWVSVH
ncbi:hypothetical protein DPMN_191788 [Dreissena polymorpha]|uniref:Uncharacterized protein n=1 Tax=Dreissena polymorpha TaxID=45954 RepID=A0A9D4BCF9_DREPO|nr:hypothetical protein DPMN_191788 [Dreissena polymorpha]